MSNKKFTTIEKIVIPAAMVVVTLIVGLLSLHGKSDKEGLNHLSNGTVKQDTDIVINNKIEAPNNTGKIEQYNNNANGTIKVDKRKTTINKIQEQKTYYIKSEDSVDQTDNVVAEFIDGKTLKIYPKIGQWNCTFAWVPLKENDSVQMTLGSNSQVHFGVRDGFKECRDTRTGERIDFYYREFDYPLTSKANPAFIKFSSTPTMILFGDTTDLRKHYMWKK